MFSSLRNHFGIPGVIAVVALVFAMLGGAYAASNESASGKATASAKKGRPGPRGPRGKPGKEGPAGPQGPAGAKGDKGDAGSNGAKGDPGSAGAPGATGATGPTGEPWPVNGTLPGGATETGSWNVKTPAVPGETVDTAISLPIPLAVALSVTNAKVNSLAAGTGTLTSGSPTIEPVTHTNNKPPWAQGTLITSSTASCIPVGTEIIAVTATSITMSANATCSGANPVGSPAWEQCDDGAGTAASAEHPEADTGFYCTFIARPSTAAAGKITVAPFKSGASSNTAVGVSTSGARLVLSSTGADEAVTGTFAVTG